MSALARVLFFQGKQVCGSDRMLSPITDKLEKMGIAVAEEENAEFVHWCDVCVYSGAIPRRHPDVVLAKKLGKKIISRAELLGQISSGKKCISVAGTHGKTTTTAMIGQILSSSNLCPTIHVGGVMNAVNDNVIIGAGDVFLTEACEYQDSFLSLKSDVSVILNIEKDHMDYFKSVESLVKSFKKFAKNTKTDGFLLINSKIKEYFSDCDCKVLTFGCEGGEYFSAKNIFQHQPGKFQFDAFEDGEFLFHVMLPVFGKHNVQNAIASIGVCRLLGVDDSIILNQLENFAGVQRRMQKVSDRPLVYHDYAHHPTEINASIESLLPMGKKIIVVFQPHTFSRTRDLYVEFLCCFDKAEEVILLPIFPAREEPIAGISSQNLAQDLSRKGVKSCFVSSFEECYKVLQGLSSDKLVLLLGAGDVEMMTKLF